MKYNVGDLVQRRISANKVVSGIITDIDKNKSYSNSQITIQWYLSDHTDTISCGHSDIDYMCNSSYSAWKHYPVKQ